MNAFVVVVLSALLSAVRCVDVRTFPPGFEFGAATAAYQVEGAWNVSDKGESLWDWFVHTNPNAIANTNNGDIAADSYHLWQQDIEMASDLGLDFYRFSISWPRLLPSGLTNHISEDGKRYYNNLINGLLKKGIKPVVTLYHWDLPLKLYNLGGWTNPLISDWFVEYASLAFSLFGDRVKTWITINEPIVVCDLTYNSGTLAPGIEERVLAPYLCNKHILLAHAKAYRIYDKHFRHKQRGRVSLANNLLWIEPLTPADKELAELALQHMVGRYSHPIYSKKGGWPLTIEKQMADYSEAQGYSTSRLPSFTEKEIKLMRGAYDFYAMNHYTSRLVRPARPGEEAGDWFVTGSPEINAVFETNPDWPYGASKLLPRYPEGIRRLIAWLRKEYGNIEFLITENGFSTSGSAINDVDRIEFLETYMEQVLLSIWEDHANVTGYTYWSLMDNFEWVDGYTLKFGLYEVDFDDPNRTRSPRASAEYYADVIRSRSLDIRQSATKLHRYKRKDQENSARSIHVSIHLVHLLALFCLLQKT